MRNYFALVLYILNVCNLGVSTRCDITKLLAFRLLFKRNGMANCTWTDDRSVALQSVSQQMIFAFLCQN